MRIAKCVDNFTFFVDNGFEKIHKFIKEMCSEENTYCDCGCALSYQYLFIILRLRDTGLLSDDFKMKCCECYNGH